LRPRLAGVEKQQQCSSRKGLKRRLGIRDFAPAGETGSGLRCRSASTAQLKLMITWAYVIMIHHSSSLRLT
jgi:hypothetical protein